MKRTDKQNKSRKKTYRSEFRRCLVCCEIFKAQATQVKLNKGKYCSRKCYSISLKGKEPWNKGKKGLQKMSIETRKKMSISGKGRIFSEEHKRKISIAVTGRILSDETKRKIGLKSLKRKKSIETRRKMSEISRGEKSHLWRGGLTSEIRKIRNSLEYRLWRESIFKRDNWTCVMCNTRGCVLNADHIKPFAFFPELRFDITNGRTLCEPCHKNTDTYGNKAKTKDYTTE